eukprot:s693_g4.t1
MLESTCLVDGSAASEQAPKTPILDKDECQKRLNQVISPGLSLYEHEDEPVSFTFNSDELDELEEYEFNFSNDESYDGEGISDAAMQQLMFPFSKEETNVDPDELQPLDALADAIEIKGLTKMQVLTDSSAMPADSRVLSTRFVRAWHEKLDSSKKPIWPRRSRLDCGTSAAHDVSGHERTCRQVMISIDVKDAFLTVQQETPAIVNGLLPNGETRACGLGRVLHASGW